MIVQNILLGLCVALMMLFGLFVVIRLDRLSKGVREGRGGEPREDSAGITFDSDASDEEIIERIREYEKEHGETKIRVYSEKKDRID